MGVSDIGGRLALGMVAGGLGTVVMTLSERMEMSISGREPSLVPGQVGASVLPRKNPGSFVDVKQLNGPVHWAHGIAMGAVRGALDGAGLHGPFASVVHFSLLWGGDAALYRGLDIADVPWRWPSDELASDLLHKAVYAGVTGAIYDALSQKTARP